MELTATARTEVCAPLTLEVWSSGLSGPEPTTPRSFSIQDLTTDLLVLCLEKVYPSDANSLFLATVGRTNTAFRDAARQVQKITRRCKLVHDTKAPDAALLLQGGSLNRLRNLQELELLNFQGPGVKALVKYAARLDPDPEHAGTHGPEHEKRHHPELCSLILSHCTINQAAWREVQRLCPRLQALTMTSCTFPDGLDGRSATPQLQLLDLSWSQHRGCHQLLEDAGPTVTHLNLRGCEWVTDHALAKAGLPHIQELEVSYTPCGDCSLTALALGCPLLRKLKVAATTYNNWFCSSWTKSALQAFQEAKPQVSVITCV